MDEDKKDLDASTEEQKADEEATREVDSKELKEKLVDDFGLDPEGDEDLLDKLVDREKSHRENLSGAIKQKIRWREKAKASEDPKDKPEEDVKSDKEEKSDIDKLVDKKLTEKFEERELNSLKLSDDLKAEVKELASLKGISVREAAQLPYILLRKEEIEKEERIKKASPRRSNRGSSVSNVDPSKPLNPADFDFGSKEGVKAWKQARAARDKHIEQKKKSS